MAITVGDVRQIAALARIGIDEARAAALVSELNSILQHMDALAGVDTDGVEPAVAADDSAGAARPDVGPPLPLARPREAFAPSMRDGFFLVPRLASHDTGESP